MDKWKGAMVIAIIQTIFNQKIFFLWLYYSQWHTDGFSIIECLCECFWMVVGIEWLSPLMSRWLLVWWSCTWVVNEIRAPYPFTMYVMRSPAPNLNSPFKKWGTEKNVIAFGFKNGQSKSHKSKMDSLILAPGAKKLVVMEFSLHFFFCLTGGRKERKLEMRSKIRDETSNMHHLNYSSFIMGKLCGVQVFKFRAGGKAE